MLRCSEDIGGSCNSLCNTFCHSMPPRKKRALEFGSASTADRPNAQVQLNDPTSTSFSERVAPGSQRIIPSLVTYSCRSFAAHLDTIFTNERLDDPSPVLRYSRPTALQRNARRWLQSLPDHLSQRLFTVLQANHPTKLSTAFIAEYFMRGGLPKINRRAYGNHKGYHGCYREQDGGYTG